MSRNCVVSICTYSHLPKAMVLAESFVGFNPGCDVVVLVADLSQAQVDLHTWPGGPATRLLGLDALGHPLVGAMHRYFDAFEFCCALKSVTLQYLLFVEGYDKVAVLDPDIMVYGPFDDVWLAVEQNDIAVTPHTNSPMPDDGEQPVDLEYATSGFINGGFLTAAANDRTAACVAWLIGKVADHGFFAPQFNAYADQTWMNYLPWYFPASTSVLRDSGLNAAYWNLHERGLTCRDGRYWCNDRPLIFFHYSGFNPRHPRQLTQHSRRRFAPEAEAALGSLLPDYAARLHSAAEEMPRLVPDRPPSTLSLPARLKMFEAVRAKRPALSALPVPLARTVANRFISIVRDARVGITKS